MDFQRLSRRELQTLCKKNKIPANMTNVAMADSLRALEFVEGIDEFSQICESETAQSSIESPVRSEVTSPYVPPTEGRSTRRRNFPKQETESTKLSARTQRTTRKTQAKYSDESETEAIETPAMMPQTNRSKSQIALACRKMDSQFKECVEEKKDDLVSPAPSGVTTRRRRGVKEESVVTRVYSTRRSVRLAEKDVELLKEIGNGNHDFPKKDLFTNYEDLKTSSNERPDYYLDEILAITDVIVDEISKEKVEAEVISAEKQDNLSVNGVQSVPTIEDKISIHSEADSVISEPKESVGMEIIEDVEFDSEIEVMKEKCGETETPNDENSAQENDGSLDVLLSEVEIEVVKSKNADENAGEEGQAVNFGDNNGLENEEDDTDKDAGCDEEASHCEENVVLESEDNFVIVEVPCDIDNGLVSEDVTDLNINESVLEINGSNNVKPSEIEIEVQRDAGFIDQAANHESEEQNNTNKDAGSHVQISEIEIELEKIEENTHKYAGCVDQADNYGENAGLESVEQHIIGKIAGCEDDEAARCGENPVLESKANVDEDSRERVDESDSANLDAAKDYLAVSPSDISLIYGEEKILKCDTFFAYVSEKDEMILAKDMELQLQQPVEEVLSIDMIAPGQVPQPACLTPNNALSAKKKRSTSVVSDNKENIDSGGKLALSAKKNTAKLDDMSVRKLKNMLKDLQFTNKLTKSEKGTANLDDLSMRKLKKMLKEKKLQIANKSSQSENEVVAPPVARSALQPLPENFQAI